jgi:DNA-binding winged helix-turn-helix (wHTH) protein
MNATVIAFGAFQLDVEAGRLLRNGRVIRLKPQPFRLLQLLASRPGELVTREEIRLLLWGADTFVDFEQGVNTAIKQIRDALKDDAERPLYLQTIPKRGYRFIAPVESGTPAPVPVGGPAGARTDLNLQKALWHNIFELRLEEERRRKRRQHLLVALVLGALVLAVAAVVVLWR